MPTAVITGCSSFVGYHVALGWDRANWRIVATARRPAAGPDVRDERLRAIACRCEVRYLDIRDEAAVQALVEETSPQLWIHHAGYADAYASLDFDIRGGMDHNVLPLYRIYPILARRRGLGVIVTGSSMEYSNAQAPNREDEACQPATPYGLTKLAETLAAMQLAERYGVPTRIARVFLPFGPLDAPGKLLPSVRRALTQDQPVALSACEQSRDFLWAGDLSPAYAALARDLDRGGARIVNVCSGAPMRVRDMLEQLADRLGKPRHLLQFGARPLRPSEPLISVGDNQRLRDLGWTPTPIAQALGLWLAAADAVAQI